MGEGGGGLARLAIYYSKVPQRDKENILLRLGGKSIGISLLLYETWGQDRTRNVNTCQ